MKQQPDKLFFDKLNTIGKEAPAMTWERIEEGLDQKKTKKFFRLSAAAAISLIAVTAITLIQSGNSTNVRIAENRTQTESNGKTELTRTDSAFDKSQEPIYSETSREDVKTMKQGILKKSEIKKQPIREVRSPVLEIASTHNTESMEQTHIVEDTSKWLSEPVQLAFKAPDKKDHFTIVLTADQTKTYLTTKSTNSEATTEEKKSSTLKKLLKKAADLKVNQDPFGELRQRKNEILALNFRSEKQRGQKK